MNVASATMQIDYLKARNMYQEYRDAVKQYAKRDPLGASKTEEAQLSRACQAILRGEVVIDAAKAIADAGLNAEGLPALAIARADWEFVHCWNYDGKVVFARNGRTWSTRGDRQTATHNVSVRLPMGQIAGRAQVPMVPPRFLPKGALSGYRILFEAVWQRQPPVDPILLRHIGGPFYVVLAQWDLSTLEQAVLRARL